MFSSVESQQNFNALVVALRTGAATAIIGAGLSAPMKPTWSSLHTELQNESRLEPRRAFNGMVAPIDFEDFRETLGVSRYLGVLRHRFGGVVSAYPDLYARLDEIQGLQQLATTNYDEFLAAVAVSNNRSLDLAVYPDLGNTDARYVYLHGRAETTNSASELVLCEDDYVRAYGSPGQAQRMLQALLSRPSVFIGSSLDDLDLQVILRERARFTAGSGSEPSAPLFAILVEPKPEGELSARDAVEIETRRLRRFAVRPIFYVRDAAHTRLRSLILELRHQVGQRPVKPLFLERAEHLDHLAAIDSPASGQVAEVVSLISAVPELARYFFGREQLSLAWFELLRDSVIIPGATEPWEVRDGGREIALWPAAPYVRRIAHDRPDAIVELFRSLQETTNWHVRSVLGEAAADLPPVQLRSVLPTLKSWMDDPSNPASHLADRLSFLAEPLSEAGELDTTSDLLKVLLSPTPSKGSSEPSTMTLHLDEAWFPQLEGSIKRLSGVRPEGAYKLLMALLQATLAAAGQDTNAHSSVWRRAIEEHEQNSKVLDLPLHFLLNAARDALLGWLNDDLSAAAAEVVSLLQSESVISRRLALWALRVHPELLPFVAPPILSEEFLDREYFHELALLIHEQLAAMDGMSKEMVHNFIRSGPLPTSEVSDEQRELEALRFRWRWLHLVPSELFTPEERAWWDEGIHRFGQHPQPFFLVWRPTEPPIVIWGRPPEVQSNPLTTAWQAGGAEALAVAFRETEGWGSGIEKLVHDDPQSLLALVQHIGPEDGERLAAYLDAYDTLLTAGADGPFDWEPLIALMERIVEQAPALPQTVTHAARLLREGITSAENPLPQALLDRSMTAMAKAVEALSDSFAVDPEQTLTMDQLNEPAGAAADSFMLGMRRWLDIDRSARRVPEAARPWIEATLSSGWGGIQMRHALGQYWPAMEWAEPGWLERHADQLWPEGTEPQSVNAKRAFLAGFVQQPETSAKAVRGLAAMLIELIADLAAEQPAYLNNDDFVDAVAQRLAIAWLWDIEGFGFGGLLGNFVATAPDSARARLVWHLGRMHRMKADQAGPDFAATRAKQEEYWQLRADELGTNLPVAEQSKELSEFCSWPLLTDRSLAELEQRLNVSIDHLARGFHAHALLRLIAARTEAEPLPALRLVSRFVDRLRVEQAIGSWCPLRELEAALDAICRSEAIEQQDQVLQLADHLARGGLPELAEKVKDCIANSGAST